MVAARRGALTAVIGPNGTGKSMLLRTLTGTMTSLAGKVEIDGQPFHRLDRRARARLLAVVLTDRVEPGMLTVGDVIALGRYPFTDWRGALGADDIGDDLRRRYLGLEPDPFDRTGRGFRH